MKSFPGEPVNFLKKADPFEEAPIFGSKRHPLFSKDETVFRMDEQKPEQECTHPCQGKFRDRGGNFLVDEPKFSPAWKNLKANWKPNFPSLRRSQPEYKCGSFREENFGIVKRKVSLVYQKFLLVKER